MVTVSHLVEDYLKRKPALREALVKGIINYVGLAESMKHEIEAELDKKVKTSAIMMSLRRHAEKFEKKFKERFSKAKLADIELNIKSGIIDITLARSRTIFTTIKKLQSYIDFEKGDILNIIHGNYEITILTNERYKERFIKELKGEKILFKESDLVALSLKLPKEFLYIPGFIHLITGALDWENINIIEIVSTFRELTIFLKEKDSTKGYKVLRNLIKFEK